MFTSPHFVKYSRKSVVKHAYFFIFASNTSSSQSHVPLHHWFATRPPPPFNWSVYPFARLSLHLAERNPSPLLSVMVSQLLVLREACLNLWYPKFRFSFSNWRLSLHDEFPAHNHSRCRFISYEILLQVSVFCDRHLCSYSISTKNGIHVE
jgi:hypothetical protein